MLIEHYNSTSLEINIVLGFLLSFSFDKYKGGHYMKSLAMF